MHTSCSFLRLATGPLLLAALLNISCASVPAPPATPDPAATARAVDGEQAPRTLPKASGRAGVAVGVHGAVASAEPLASQVGLQVLKGGGNAIDAAVAVAFALAVTHPSAGNIGGGGFMLVHLARGEQVAFDYREVAPLSASRDMYLDAAGNPTSASLDGPLAAGIPGTVAGMERAHARFGTKPWAELLAPAIALARDGHALDADHASDMQHAAARMRELGFEDSARVYSGADRQPLAAGALWRQPDLAVTLTRIAERGARDFYEGVLAQALIDGVRTLGGNWSAADLAQYQALERQPVRFTYLGHQVVTMPPPSAGGVVLRQILFVSEQLQLRKFPARSVDAFHVYLEATRRAYADRNRWLADPDFVNVPVASLIDPTYVASRMANIDLQRATPSSEIAAGTPVGGSTQTTHFSVVDDAGNAVSNTYTLNTGFGAKIVVPGLGILLNNEMDDFAASPGKPNVYGLVQGEQNRIEPKKRMLSSMTPTMVLKEGQLRAVLGTPGGPTITTTVAQLMRDLIDYGMPLDEAVALPRVHHQWLPDRVMVEASVEPELVAGLRARGHEVAEISGHTIGHANCIEVDPQTKGFRAVADVTRGSGGAAAY
jgi:gamma-glutamyltranspeptidase / glutathione hydrolase